MKLILRVALIFLTLFIPFVSYAGYLDSDVGMDLYKKIDAGSDELKKTLINTRIKESKFTPKLNALTKGMCAENCFGTKLFTIDDLNAVKAGSITEIKDHMAHKKDMNNTELAKQLGSKITDAYDTLKSEVDQEQARMERMSSLGIYTDGSLKNSSFDLMVDIDKINDVIFAKELAYDGTMRNSDSLSRFLSGTNPDTENGSWDTSNEDLSYLPASIRSKLAPSSTPAEDALKTADNSGNTSTSWLAPYVPLCNSGTTTSVSGLGDGIFTDIAEQLATGENSGNSTHSGSSANTGTGKNSGLGAVYGSDQESGGFFSPNTWIGGGAGSKDTFPCSGFICVFFEAIFNDTSLLSGGNSYSIETMLNRNLKIVSAFENSSFDQWKVTTLSMGNPMKGINLPSMLSLMTHVSYKAPPILNLNAASTPRGPTASDDQKEFSEIKSGILGDYGFIPDRENTLEDPSTAHTAVNISHLSTNAAMQAFEMPTGRRGEYFQAKERKILTAYADSFSSNLLELEAFSSAFADEIKDLTAITTKFNQIKNGGK